MIDALVIGGGISGLSAAYELVRRGFKVQIVERQNRCGGAAVSEKIGGFLMEHGPSSISSSVEGVEAYSRQLGLDGVKCGLKTDVRYRYLVKGGRLHPVAPHPLGFFTSSYLSPRGRLALALEIFRCRGGASQESVAQFCDRRFGREFTSQVIDPLVAGLYGAKADGICLDAAFPALADMEARYGSLTAAVIARKISGGRMPARRLFSWAGGIADLPRALAARLAPCIQTGAAVRRIAAVPGGFSIDTGRNGRLLARNVILAVQPHAAAALVENLDAGAAAALYDIPAPPVSVVYLGFRTAQIRHKLDGIGYLTPQSEGRTASGVLFPSSMFARRAPEGHAAFSVYIGGSRAPEVAGRPPEELVVMARAELVDTVGARGAPVVARVRQWARGLPQPAPGHEQRLDALKKAEGKYPGLFFTGNYFSGPGMARCINNAVETALRAVSLMEQQGPVSDAAEIKYNLQGVM